LGLGRWPVSQIPEIRFVVSNDLDSLFAFQLIGQVDALLTHFPVLTTENDRVSNHALFLLAAQSLTRIFRPVTNDFKLSLSLSKQQ